LEPADKTEVVDLMMETCGQQSVEVIREVFMDMKSTDLVQSLPETSSGPKAAGSTVEAFGVKTTEGEKQSVDEQWPALIQKVKTMKSVITLLLETLADLSDREQQHFKEVLERQRFVYEPYIKNSWRSLMMEDMQDIVFLMVKTFGQQSLVKTKDILFKINRRDLVQRLSDSSSGPKKKHFMDEQLSTLIQKVATMAAVKDMLLETLHDLSYQEFEKFKEVLELTVFQEDLQDISVMFWPSRSLESGAHGGIMDSSDWTKLEPEVNSTDADDAPTYNLQSEAGKFECSVSELRWVSEEKVSFKYQFCSWEGHMERMESLQYMPAGPLMDITVTAGKLNEVYLPHWICTDDNPEILDKFAVLHIDACGDVVEDASEVTSSHVKLSEPIFSPRAVLMKLGFPVKINCKVLIYCEPNITSLRLHVYLIPKDPALEKTMNKKKSSKGYKFIEKPHPDKYLKMEQEFVLKADIDTAKISPERLTLRHDSQDPNFYEVYIKNPDRDFNLTLSHSCTNKCKPECKPAWTCEIQKGHLTYLCEAKVCEHLLSVTGLTTITSVNHVQEIFIKHQCQLTDVSCTTMDVKDLLLETLNGLSDDEMNKFKHLLPFTSTTDGRAIPAIQLRSADRRQVVNLTMETFGQQSVEVIREVLMSMNRTDLVQRLPETS
ncbi:uncharacterized protein LOC121906043 isoform X4, partial [Scomber scombrus]